MISTKLTWDKRSNRGFQMYISRFRRFIVPIPPEILILETLTVSMTDRSKTIISSDQHNWLHVTKHKSADTKSSKSDLGYSNDVDLIWWQFKMWVTELLCWWRFQTCCVWTEGQRTIDRTYQFKLYFKLITNISKLPPTSCSLKLG